MILKNFMQNDLNFCDKKRQVLCGYKETPSAFSDFFTIDQTIPIPCSYLSFPATSFSFDFLQNALLSYACLLSSFSFAGKFDFGRTKSINNQKSLWADFLHLALSEANCRLKSQKLIFLALQPLFMQPVSLLGVISFFNYNVTHCGMSQFCVQIFIGARIWGIFHLT